MHEANGAGCRQRGDSPTQARLWEPRRSQSPSVAPSSSSRSGSHDGATRITPCTRTKPMSCSRTEGKATMAWYVGSPSIKVETRIALTASVERMSRNRLCQAGTTRPCTAIWAVDALPPGLLSENRSTLNLSLGHTRPSPPSSHGLGGPGHRPKAPWGTMPHRPWQGFPRPQVGTPTGRHPPLTDWAGGWGRKWLWTHGQQISAALNYICCHQTHVIPLPPPPFPILGSRVWGGDNNTLVPLSVQPVSSEKPYMRNLT